MKPDANILFQTKDRRSQRGSVIVFVLGVILLTSFLITRLMDRATIELAAESKAASRTGMRQEAYSALEASLAVIADYKATDNGLHAPEQGWGRPLESINYMPGPGFSVEVSVLDETGKISLPLADETVLRGYLAVLGCPATSLDEVVTALMVWSKTNYVPQGVDFDAEDFGGSELPYKAPQRALRSFEELRAIPACQKVFFDEGGHWNELGEQFMAGASLFQYSSSNVNSARPEGMLALGMGVNSIDSLVIARDANRATNNFYRSTGELTGIFGKDAPPPNGMGAEAICLHLIVKVKKGSREYQLDAWVSPAGSTPAPMPPRPQGLGPNGEITGETVIQIPAKRTSPRNKVDSPFQILELQENHGT